jgi:hypothetical protein
MPNKDEAIAMLEERHDKFRAKIADLPDPAYNETWLGNWNLSQLLAHMSGWFREIAPGFERVQRGERPTLPGVDYSNSDQWNAGFTKDTRPGRAALNDWDAAYAGYVSAARALDADKFGDDPESGRPRIGNRLLQGSGIGHFEEHQEQLDTWLAGRSQRS